jgi:arylsulfatase A-like enzyme
MTPTPRIDKFASKGIRFNSYYVEAQCTPTRSALMTGRYSVRSRTYTVPWPGTGPYGLSPRECMLPKLLSDAGCATALYGKWHLGEVPGRLPSDMGFDEWWGLKTLGMGRVTWPIRSSRNRSGATDDLGRQRARNHALKQRGFSLNRKCSSVFEKAPTAVDSP